MWGTVAKMRVLTGQLSPATDHVSPLVTLILSAHQASGTETNSIFKTCNFRVYSKGAYSQRNASIFLVAWHGGTKSVLNIIIKELKYKETFYELEKSLVFFPTSFSIIKYVLFAYHPIWSDLKLWYERASEKQAFTVGEMFLRYLQNQSSLY